MNNETPLAQGPVDVDVRADLEMGYITFCLREHATGHGCIQWFNTLKIDNDCVTGEYTSIPSGERRNFSCDLKEIKNLAVRLFSDNLSEMKTRVSTEAREPETTADEAVSVEPDVVCGNCRHRRICEFHGGLIKLETHFAFKNRTGKNHGLSFEDNKKVSELFANNCDYYELDQSDS